MTEKKLPRVVFRCSCKAEYAETVPFHAYAPDGSGLKTDVWLELSRSAGELGWRIFQRLSPSPVTGYSGRTWALQCPKCSEGA